MKKKKEKTEQQKKEAMRKKCVELAKKICRVKNKFTCQYCGNKEPNVKTHGSHIYSEGVYKSMSADVDNILCLCYTHHLGGWMNTVQPSWHKNPLEMTDWFKEKYPELYQELKLRSQKTITCDMQFWTAKLAELKEELAKLTVDNF